MAAPTLPNVPYQSQAVEQSGFFSPPWTAFFRELFNRVGKNIALTNTQLEELQAANLATINTEITNLQSLAFIQNIEITSLQLAINDLSVGPLP